MAKIRGFEAEDVEDVEVMSKIHSCTNVAGLRALVQVENWVGWLLMARKKKTIASPKLDIDGKSCWTDVKPAQ